MGFKNAAQRKAVWASRNEKKKGSPAKQSIPDFKGTGNRLKRNMGQSVTGLSDERSQDKVINKVTNTTKKLNPVQTAFTEYMDWNDDGKVTTSDVVKEAASWLVPGGVFVKGAKYLNKARKFLSPFKHCDSEMMHSGGWGQVRKYNSPGTTGNKEGIKHNEKMRQEIGTFKMPYSPLNNNDSIAKAWKDFKAGYMNRKTHPATGKPISAEENLAEYNREKGEFYYDHDKKKLRLIPTDDGEQKIMKGIEKNQLAPDRKSSHDYRSPYVADQRRQRNNALKSSAKIPGKAIRKAKDAADSPLNKEGKKDACYHKVKSRVKVWPSAYASGQLVQCRKAGAANWGEKSKKK